MSGLGHLAPAFVAKSAAPGAPLLALAVASEANDLLYGLFSSVGIEPKAVITAMDFSQGVQYLTPVANPWSHGLLMSIVWAVSASAIAFVFFRDRRTSAVFGLVVLSHWLLDFLMHSNLPLLLSGSPLVGLGLENSGNGFLLMTALDLFLFAAGVALYIHARRQTAAKRARQS